MRLDDQRPDEITAAAFAIFDSGGLGSPVSSAPEAGVSPSLVPAFLAEQQRGC
jgi:hypothetical protein